MKLTSDEASQLQLIRTLLFQTTLQSSFQNDPLTASSLKDLIWTLFRELEIRTLPEEYKDESWLDIQKRQDFTKFRINASASYKDAHSVSNDGGSNYVIPLKNYKRKRDAESISDNLSVGS